MTNKLKTGIIITSLIAITPYAYGQENLHNNFQLAPPHPDYCKSLDYFDGNVAMAGACLFMLMTKTQSIVPDPKPGVVYYFDDWGVGSDYQVPKQ